MVMKYCTSDNYTSQRYYGNAELIRECFRKPGPFIKSCRAKDILPDTRLATHLDEVRPGLGRGGSKNKVLSIAVISIDVYLADKYNGCYYKDNIYSYFEGS